MSADPRVWRVEINGVSYYVRSKADLSPAAAQEAIERAEGVSWESEGWAPLAPSCIHAVDLAPSVVDEDGHRVSMREAALDVADGDVIACSEWP